MFLNKRFFFSNLNKLTLFEKQPHVAVAVSGGPDSMALVYLINKWIDKKNGKLTALIFNHRIRNYSNEEANEVQTTLTKMKINSCVINAKKNHVIKKNMSQARANRFNGLLSFCKKNNILHLFLGHHFDDNLETFLIRRLNGSNLEGLGSMSLVTYINRVQILRPFLKINKKSIVNFNNKNKINFINDPSNEDINFTRVKVRSFLKKKQYQNKIKNDFKIIKKEIKNYKKMIWELFFKNIVRINSKQIIINFEKFIKNDDLIIEKHILIFLKFFSNQNYQTRTIKIKLLLEAIKKTDFKMFNLSSVIVQKYGSFLIFSQK